MKIDRVETFVLKAPLGAERFWYSQVPCGERQSLLVRIATSDGLVGWGEGGVSMPVAPVAACVREVFAPRLLGRDPLATGPLWEELYALSRDWGRKSTPIDALSAVDIALWDIRGKAAGKPVHALLGGAFRDRVRRYATGLYYRGADPEDVPSQLAFVREEAQRLLALGFTAIKGKIGLLSPADDLRRMEALRETAGDAALLMADANHAYNRHTALAVGRALEGLGFHWLEEPVVPEDLDGCAALRRQLAIPIATGETEYTRYGFLEILRRDAADILQPDLARCGGLSEAMRILALATSFHTPVCLHVWGSGVALAAALQFCAVQAPCPHTALPRAPENEPMLEYDCSPNPLREELLAEPFAVEGDAVLIPQGPGLGIEIEPAALERYAAAHDST